MFGNVQQNIDEEGIKLEERNNTLDKLEKYIQEFSFERDFPYGGSETVISVDHLDEWFIKPMRENGTYGD
jgi:hypothetical protein